MAAFSNIGAVNEILDVKGIAAERLRDTDVRSVREELAGLKEELPPDHQKKLRELPNAVEARLDALQSKGAGLAALREELATLRSTLAKGFWQPEIAPVSSQLAEGTTKDVVRVGEKIALEAPAAAGTYLKEQIRENPGVALAVMGGLTAALLFGKKVAKKAWDTVTWPFRQLWEHKWTILTLGGLLGGAYYMGKSANAAEATPEAKAKKKEEEKKAVTAATAPDGNVDVKKLPDGTSLLSGETAGKSLDLEGEKMKIIRGPKGEVLVEKAGKKYRLRSVVEGKAGASLSEKVRDVRCVGQTFVITPTPLVESKPLGGGISTPEVPSPDVVIAKSEIVKLIKAAVPNARMQIDCSIAGVSVKKDVWIEEVP